MSKLLRLLEKWRAQERRYRRESEITFTQIGYPALGGKTLFRDRQIQALAKADQLKECITQLEEFAITLTV